ncbi:MAG: recombinase XerC [Alphaproteobacteria bacterium MedPE-SWcel]|nr:MAG: recombinase XerC [Alphaproteobacteria bacterium MedPE-SWcel]
MSSTNAELDDSLRQRIIETPSMVLDDPNVMRALVAANERAMGANIVDLRGIAMDRLETRLDRLEDTHRSVIAAAYENLAGANQIQRAVLRLLDPESFAAFMDVLRGDLQDILRVDGMALILETTQEEAGAAVERVGDLLKFTEAGFIESYISRKRSFGGDRPVHLRQIGAGLPRIYGERAASLRSEACLKLDLGPGRLPGLLVFGSDDPHQFTPQHGTDLLAFFGGVFERCMRRWLA